MNASTRLAAARRVKMSASLDACIAHATGPAPVSREHLLDPVTRARIAEEARYAAERSARRAASGI